MRFHWKTLALAIARAALVGGVPAHAADPADVKIGFLVNQPDDPWFQDEWRFADQASK